VKRVKQVLKYLFGLMFILAGANHFIKPEFYLPMMPPYIPAHELMVILSGIAEMILGLLLWVPKASRLAAWGLVALLFAVFPANLHMALHPEQFPDMPQMGLWIRLPLQGVMIWWAWLYTRKERV
jgi:uncharacterized membrane protein